MKQNSIWHFVAVSGINICSDSERQPPRAAGDYFQQRSRWREGYVIQYS